MSVGQKVDSEPWMCGRSGHGRPNAARAKDGNGVRPPSTNGKNPGGIFERVPEKLSDTRIKLPIQNEKEP
ncbi:MAG: hypothetical protein BWY32_01307 [bacterium ADurb.Bin243]|nr:MAG: hypothetical protein BWY32_01307 [bacterium ADurb.Bin243]